MMEFTIFTAIAILIYLFSLFIAHKKRSIVLQGIVIAAIMAVWALIPQLQQYLSGKIIFEEVGLVQGMILQTMDRIFFNIFGPIIALVVAVFKKTDISK